MRLPPLRGEDTEGGWRVGDADHCELPDGFESEDLWRWSRSLQTHDAGLDEGADDICIRIRCRERGSEFVARRPRMVLPDDWTVKRPFLKLTSSFTTSAAVRIVAPQRAPARSVNVRAGPAAQGATGRRLFVTVRASVASAVSRMRGRPRCRMTRLDQPLHRIRWQRRSSVRCRRHRKVRRR